MKQVEKEEKKKKKKKEKGGKNKNRHTIRPGPHYEVATCDASFQGVWDGPYEPCIVESVQRDTVSITCLHDKMQLDVPKRFVRRQENFEELNKKDKNVTKKKSTKTIEKNTKKTTITTKRTAHRRQRQQNKIIRICCTGLTPNEQREVLRMYVLSSLLSSSIFSLILILSPPLHTQMRTFGTRQGHI